ncbi:alpha-galactosidase [Kineosporia mesophila]|uniref:Alpha-galactosidase n=1 Tax=Kineosporia mesophila TaxID=566012 RepID=A0ABP6ZF89_9ACTN|nr:glycoside hydrolase family 36 protein [Kineosporia mesophila]MCD5350092.1 alpha-galactosidase [Kineosporia mesophila]
MTASTVFLDGSGLDVVLDLAPGRPAGFRRLTAAGSTSPADSEPDLRPQPLVELLVLGEGRSLTNTRLSHTAVGSRLRPVGEHRTDDGAWRQSRIHQRDDVTGLETVTVLRWLPDGSALRTWSEVINTSDRPYVLQALSSFATGALLEADERVEDLLLYRARSEWCGESRWMSTGVHSRDGLADIDVEVHHHEGRGVVATTSHSTWSSGEWLPTGLLENTATGRAWAWQVEHNGAWHWELTARADGTGALALVVSGPDDLHHAWTTTLEPGQTFASVPVSIAVSQEGYQGALAELTRHRRALIRVQPGDAGYPLIFNDYMNTLMGDPTTAKLLPLIDAAAEAGAEVFCIDAGWYDDGGAWWDSVGEWEPSTARFPDGGLRRVLDRIRERGMKPGLWLEPEVIGVRSPAAARLPDDAFLQRHGQRVVEHDRYLLDLRHPAAVQHLDTVVDRLVNDYGARYFKLDYNVTPGAGTDLNTSSVGEGLLGHNRAHLAWLERVLERHPSVIFENCASGAMRMDYAMMSLLQLQSTSDQQDARLYAAIAAAAPASLVPEQAGNWAYPRAGDPLEDTAFTMVNGLVGRLYLAGHLDRMAADELALVHEGIAVHRVLRDELPQTVPFWPLGLPGWFDPTVALGLRGVKSDVLAVWQREPASAPVLVELSHLHGRDVRIETLYPRSLPSWDVSWDATTGVLTLVPLAAGPSARLFRILPS